VIDKFIGGGPWKLVTSGRVASRPAPTRLCTRRPRRCIATTLLAPHSRALYESGSSSMPAKTSLPGLAGVSWRLPDRRTACSCSAADATAAIEKMRDRCKGDGLSCSAPSQRPPWRPCFITQIAIDEFAKVDMRVGEVRSASRVKG
jgi:hypothetical protein